jgi:hypothetical protein
VRRLDRLLDRSGFKVKTVMEPLEDLSEDVDLVVVSPDLREDAQSAAGFGVPVLVTTPATAAEDFADLVRQLEAGTELTVERPDRSAPTGPHIVTYRGSMRIE